MSPGKMNYIIVLSTVIAMKVCHAQAIDELPSTGARRELDGSSTGARRELEGSSTGARRELEGREFDLYIHS